MHEEIPPQQTGAKSDIISEIELNSVSVAKTHFDIVKRRNFLFVTNKVNYPWIHRKSVIISELKFPDFITLLATVTTGCRLKSLKKNIQTTPSVYTSESDRLLILQNPTKQPRIFSIRKQLQISSLKEKEIKFQQKFTEEMKYRIPKISPLLKK